ncbi:hypothetical protein HKX48_001623 [Thoreauomyces humboldtii]|nr:hypothetical protein HKX48_001623 [Thoreauomyces humboldtii]
MTLLKVALPPIPGLAVQPSVHVRTVEYVDVTDSILDWLLESCVADPRGRRLIGIDVKFDGALIGVITISTESRCLIIFVPPPRKRHRSTARPPNLALGLFLADLTIRKSAMDLSRGALLPFANFRHVLRGGWDLGYEGVSVANPLRRDKFDLYELFSDLYLPKGLELSAEYPSKMIDWKWTNGNISHEQQRRVVLEAYLSFKCGEAVQYDSIDSDVAKEERIPMLDLMKTDARVVDQLATHNVADLVVETLRTCEFESNFSKILLQDDGTLHVVCSQFENKLSTSNKVVIRLADGALMDGIVLESPHGRTKIVKLREELPEDAKINSIVVTEQYNFRKYDECARARYPQMVLHGAKNPMRLPLYRAIFGSNSSDEAPASPVEQILGSLNKYSLNPSQEEAVRLMLTGPSRLTLVHGPPGAGKTHAITAAVAEGIATSKDFFVLTSQTNAATRNLAEKLFARGVMDFKILVSDNYFVEWHEAAYLHLNDHVIQTTHMAADRAGRNEALIGPRTVVLCSIAQLSNPNLIPLFHTRKLSHLVIDEASQLSLSHLPHIIDMYYTSLKRISAVGDPHQLAPYGNDISKSVSSIYENHESDILLNCQYRMPADLGKFISDAVYDCRLVSNKPPREESSVALINVEGPGEESAGTGWVNHMEADAVIYLVEKHFLHHNFLIVVPYVRQKGLISTRLRERIRALHRLGKHLDVRDDLADERVHTVDTVQGQESDVILFSAVRTHHVGFLAKTRRMNVALTRCKERLIIVARMRFFSSGEGERTLLGKLINYFAATIHVQSAASLLDGSAALSFERRSFPEQIPGALWVVKDKAVTTKKKVESMLNGHSMAISQPPRIVGSIRASAGAPAAEQSSSDSGWIKQKTPRTRKMEQRKKEADQAAAIAAVAKCPGLALKGSTKEGDSSRANWRAKPPPLLIPSAVRMPAAPIEPSVRSSSRDLIPSPPPGLPSRPSLPIYVKGKMPSRLHGLLPTPIGSKEVTSSPGYLDRWDDIASISSEDSDDLEADSCTRPARESDAISKRAHRRGRRGGKRRNKIPQHAHKGATPTDAPNDDSARSISGCASHARLGLHVPRLGVAQLDRKEPPPAMPTRTYGSIPEESKLDDYSRWLLDEESTWSLSSYTFSSGDDDDDDLPEPIPEEPKHERPREVTEATAGTDREGKEEERATWAAQDEDEWRAELCVPGVTAPEKPISTSLSRFAVLDFE